MRILRSVLSFFFMLVVATTAMAELKLPSVIGDNMVLQQGETVGVWGWANAGEKVNVTFQDKTYSSEAGQDGCWAVKLDSSKADATSKTMLIETASGEKKELKNILVGEVWVCSGQSNMQWTVARAKNPKEEIAAANYPEIRLFQVKRVTAAEPQDDCSGKWVVCSPETVAGFSALGYFFGRELNQDMKVPVGLINTSWGGTPSEAWTAREVLEKEPMADPLLAHWDERIKRDGGKITHCHTPACLYNAMLHPFFPYAIRGAIWYQGETNVPRAVQYETIFPMMIENWRDAWGKADMPFGFVQIAPFRYNKKPDSGRLVERCAELWEAQLKTLQNLDNIGMVVVSDIGNLENIHPKNKQDVGRRMADWALATVYGKSDLDYTGPVYHSMQKEDDGKIRLFFDHAEGLASRDGKPLDWFTIAGSDEKFVPAEAKVEGETIVVSSDQVAEPVAVRFGWHELATPNLINKAGLPTSPFRTDDFKRITEGVYENRRK